jgi:hypothetical protein
VRHPEFAQRFVDLHVEDHVTPIKEMARLLQIHQGFHGAGDHMELALEYEAAGRADLARLERERVHDTMVAALQRNEKDATLLNGLAWSCAVHDVHLDDALRAADRAAQLQPKSTDILDTLAGGALPHGKHRQGDRGRDARGKAGSQEPLPHRPDRALPERGQVVSPRSRPVPAKPAKHRALAPRSLPLAPRSPRSAALEVRSSGTPAHLPAVLR